MGHYHKEVIAHIQQLIDSPKIILSPDADPSKVVLVGLNWTNLKAVVKAWEHAPKHVYLCELFIIFCEGALTMLQHFSVEFIERGAIDCALKTPGQKEVFMPATNNCNEGTLGHHQIRMCKFPTMTYHQ